MTERQQRRLAAILAAEIAGYSALMGGDEARTVRDLKAHQAVVLPIVDREVFTTGSLGLQSSLADGFCGPSSRTIVPRAFKN